MLDYRKFNKYNQVLSGKLVRGVEFIHSCLTVAVTADSFDKFFGCRFHFRIMAQNLDYGVKEGQIVIECKCREKKQ